MSYREVRSFAETMRLLGYPNLISMESFKKPNVELVANCVYWLIKRYEPSAEVVYDIELESDRVLFFKEACKVALSKGRIKLNVKKLYESNGHAVQEMIKLAGVLKSAMRSTSEEDLDFAALQQMAAQKNINDAKQVQKLCSDITADGSSLFFMIEREMGARNDRLRVLSRATEVSEFERRLRELLQNVSQQVDQLQQSIANLTTDESTLEQKIENKKTQLERAQKRFKSLMAVRPQFVEEYDKHEAELQSQFVKYLEQYRNLEYLEHELAVYNAEEDARLEEQETRLRVMRERLRKEELKTLRQDNNLGSRRGGDDREPGPSRPAPQHRRDSTDDDDDDDTEGDDEHMRPQNALGRSRPSPMAETIQQRHQQNFNGGDDSDDEDDSPSTKQEVRSGLNPFQHMIQPPMEQEAQPRSSSPSASLGINARKPPVVGGGSGGGGAARAGGRLAMDDSDDSDDSSSEISSDDDDSSDVSLDSDDSDDSDI